MHVEQLLPLLEAWKAGRLPVESLQDSLAAGYTSTAIAADALVDLDRVRRCGFPEVVYGTGKTPALVAEILQRQQSAGQASLVTRASLEQFQAVHAVLPAAEWNAVGRTIRLGTAHPDGSSGKVVVVTAGATDRPIAEEAAETARWMGCTVRLLADVGVAGPQRLLERVRELNDADVVVVVAGMEGALPSVVGGWVAAPVIAVPTSVGYGAQLQGLAPLLSMLNSCAANVAVVNIDAGFKGGYLAGLIARRMQRTNDVR
jgi:NCAIR mutase (PurE)-related protein